jgi:hypothetical protein
MSLLAVYDANVDWMREDVADRTSSASEVVEFHPDPTSPGQFWDGHRPYSGRHGLAYSVGIRNLDELLEALGAVLARHATFDNILFITHGTAGRIWFGDDYMDATAFRRLAPMHLSRLCRNRAHICFTGCSIAAGASGWAFLEAVGQVFLTNVAGSVSASTSWGWDLPFDLDFGHPIHVTGNLRTVYIRGRPDRRA